MKTELDKILTERSASYGSFSDVARVTELLENGLRSGNGWSNLDVEAKQGMRFIVHKLARCVCGMPTQDSLVDIQGYAECILRNSKSVVGVAENKKADTNSQNREQILNDLFALLNLRLNAIENKQYNKFVMVQNDCGKLGFIMFRVGDYLKVFYIMKIGDCENVYIGNYLLESINQLDISPHFLEIKDYLANVNNLNDSFNKDFLKHLSSLKGYIFGRAKLGANSINPNHRDMIDICDEFNIEIYNNITTLDSSESMQIPFIDDEDLYFVLLKKIIYARCHLLHKSIIEKP